MTRVQFSQSRLRTSSRIGEPERPAVADAAEDLGPVLLDGLARPAAVAALAAGEVDREVVLGQGEPGGHALDGRPERLSVRLAGGEEPERGHSAAAAARPVLGRLAGRLALGRAQAAGARLGQLRLHQRRAAPAGRSTA